MCDATLASCFTLPSRDQLLQGAKLRFNGASDPVVWEGGEMHVFTLDARINLKPMFS